MTTDTILIFVSGSVLSFFVAIWYLFGPRLRNQRTPTVPVVELRISLAQDVRVDTVRASGVRIVRASSACSPTHNDKRTCTVDPVGLTEQLDALILASATEFTEPIREAFPALPAR
jgi:hypothetical protein